jgi:hypothetical protein
MGVAVLSGTKFTADNVTVANNTVRRGAIYGGCSVT